MILRRFSVGYRIAALAVVGVLSMGILGSMLFGAASKVESFSVEEAGRVMLDGQKQKLQVATHSVAVSLGALLAEVDSHDEKIATIRKALDEIRFEDDKSGYYFAYDGTVNVALPPKKELQGKDLGHLKDKNGVYLVKELNEKSANGGGFVQYIWPKPGAGDVPKLGYAELIPGTKIWVGTGVYLDNIDVVTADINDNISGMFGDVAATTGAVTLTVLLVLAAAAFFIYRSIFKPFGRVVEVVGEMAGGDYEARLPEDGKDEVAELEHGINVLADAVQQALADAETKTIEAEQQAQKALVAMQEAEEAKKKAEQAKVEGQRHAAQRLSEIVGRMGQACGDLCEKISETTKISEEQKDKSTQTATAIEQMNATVLEVARGASEAASQAEEAKTKADQGSGVVRKSIDAIEQVRDRSDALKTRLGSLNDNAQSIGRIMDVINDIADQTNLLALNAAIEAARAGDAGRGFAVVADEVRKLAEKTMEATKEVGRDITSIQQGAGESASAMDDAAGLIEKAVGYAEDSGAMLSEIVELSNESSDRVRSIATAAEEQSAATEEISRAGEDVNQTAGLTANAMVHSESIVNELVGLSSDLQALISELNA